MEQFLRRFGRDLDMAMEELPFSSGSGFIFRIDGNKVYVLTNNHVVGGNTEDKDISLRLDHSLVPKGVKVSRAWKGVEVPYGSVRVVGRDELSDLAVIEFDKPEGVTLTALPLGDSDALEVGEWVLALGNPLELNNSVSQGIVSAKGRSLGSRISLARLLQTTAIINPGNSGGPLVNLAGEVIGVNNAIASSNGLWQGVGFAIPVSDAKRIADQLIDRGSVQRGYLGIRMGSTTERPELARRLGVGTKGVLVVSVVKGRPGDKAGLMPGDVITSIDGAKVSETDELLEEIAVRMPGDTVEVEIVRLEESEPQRKTLTITLSERPSDQELARAEEEEIRDRPRLRLLERADTSTLGLTLEETTEPAGLRIAEVAPDSPADRLGLRPGDIITGINGTSAPTLADVEKALEADKGYVFLNYLRDGKAQHDVLQYREDSMPKKGKR
jgi:serine protease Do